jgi:hypothetical protein
MLIAIVTADWSPAVPISAFIQETCEIELRGVEREIVAEHLKAAKRHLCAEDYFAACLEALEARAVCDEIEGPMRLEGVGKHLCRWFRIVFTQAPAGFERIGRGGKT